MVFHQGQSCRIVAYMGMQCTFGDFGMHVRNCKVHKQQVFYHSKHLNAGIFF